MKAGQYCAAGKDGGNHLKFRDSTHAVALLKACATQKDLHQGIRVHSDILKRGLLKNNCYVASTLVNMYAKCGALAKAAQVLENLHVRDAVIWSALISGYAQQGQGEEALKCFERMQREGLSPNAVTFTCILRACGSIRAADKGEQIHNEVVRRGLLAKDIMLGNALVDMYAKCGALAKAAQVLDELPNRDVVTWNALIAGYAQLGEGDEALKCFEQMQHEGVSPDTVTFICILKACGSVGAADKGELIHEEIARQGLLRKDIVLGTTLVDMYSKCGALAKAAQVLHVLPVRDVVSWNALITGYGQRGQGDEALKCFKWMQHDGLSPNAVTLACLLSACSRSGLLDEGQTHFANMSTKYGITPDVEHLTCMVDLFSRAGEFDRALAVIKKTSFSAHLPVWHSLLCACRQWGNVKLGRLAFDMALQIDAADTTAYVLMANIYAVVGMQEDSKYIEAMSMLKAKMFGT